MSFRKFTATEDNVNKIWIVYLRFLDSEKREIYFHSSNIFVGYTSGFNTFSPRSVVICFDVLANLADSWLAECQSASRDLEITNLHLRFS